MSNFDSLGFDEAPVPVDYQNLPEQFVSYPTPQPGPGYIFQLAALALSDDCWLATLDDQGNRRLQVNFGADKDGVGSGKELVIVKDPHGELNGQLFRWKVNNITRQWDEGKSQVSRFDYLLISLDPGIDLSNSSNGQYAQALCVLSGRMFSATVSWSARCSKDNDVRKVVTEGGEAETQSGVKGCGQRYGLRRRTNRRTGEKTELIPRGEDGRYLEHFTCVTENCGADLRAFTDLENFLFVEGQGQDQAQAQGQDQLQEGTPVAEASGSGQVAG